MTTAGTRKHHKFSTYRKLAIVSLVVGFLAAFLGLALKKLTEHYESALLAKAALSPVYVILFPFIGLSIIYALRQYLFKKKENKGIKEIFDCTLSKKKSLPLYKIPSHFVNGLITVSFGGSTGIEVSTVVAAAAIGSVAQRKENVFRQYKTELICAGVAAGITVLFNSPIAGILFGWEVIAKRLSRTFLFTSLISVAVAFGLLFVINEPPLFPIRSTTWSPRVLPYFILLGVIAALISIYLTRCVFIIKRQFSKIDVHFFKIILGSAIISSAIVIFPQLYGDGYHILKDLLNNSGNIHLTVTSGITLLGLLLLKPILTSVTLASGGDGGVFGPSLFIGGFLGLLTALVLNSVFGANVIPLNFMVIGMAAMLSASIHAPFTAIFVICGLTNDYTLLIPVAVACLVSKYTAKMIYPKTVYTYKPQPAN